MHFQTDRIKAKTLISFSILILAFTGCTSVEYQRMQNERDTRREVYEDARRKEFRKRSRNLAAHNMLGKWQFFELVVEERGGSEDILKTKAALTASKLKGLRLRFWKNGDNYFYRLENVIAKSYGTSKTWSGQLQFHPISGSQIPDLIFNFVKGTHKQVLLSDGEVDTMMIDAKIMGVAVKGTQLDLELDLGMVLSPEGWLRRGNIRCSFQRIE
ncbi:hypothetical protein C6503_00695 [Candidatus Poribacteria bacterium]|nr:MAG: hypothetical protein C6503_00695 [Candidatus Poribacteria bacterium]